MAAVPIIIIAEKLFEAALWVTGLLAAGVVVEKAIDAAKESEDEFDQKETKACVTCGTPPLEHPPVKSGTPPFPADSQELPNRTETPNNGPVGANDTGGQESIDTGPTVYNSVPPKNKKARTAKLGEKVRTPDSHPEDFKRGKKGRKVNIHTGDVWDKSHTTHNDPEGEWKVGTKKGQAPRKTNKITIGKDGTVIKIDR